MTTWCGVSAQTYFAGHFEYEIMLKELIPIFKTWWKVPPRMYMHAICPCVCVLAYRLTEHALGCTGRSAKKSCRCSETVDDRR